MAAVAAPAALASPESRALVRQGADDLALRRWEDALRRFEAASAADPADAEAVFFQGVALNRLGRYAEALERLQRARARGAAHPDLRFELGWSLVGARRFNEAVVELEQYEREHPGRGQTSEFLGRAHLGLKQHDRAEARLREAMRRDPELRQTALYHLAQLQHRRDNAGGVRDSLESLLREAPESPLSRSIREQLARTLPPPTPERPWSVQLTTAAGYNSNVIALGERVPLPEEISGKSSGFVRFAAGASYDWRPTAADTLSAGYGFLADVYEAVPSSDLRDHVLVATYRRQLDERWAASLTASDEFTEVGGSSFRNQITLRPAVVVQATDWAALEAAWAVAFSDYYFSTPPVQDRDGTSHTLSATAAAVVPGTSLESRVTLFHTWSDADGADFDLDSLGASVGLAHPLPWRLLAEATWTRTHDHYRRRNSLTNFTVRRKEDTDAVSLQLSRPVFDWMRVFGRYDRVNANSNIPFFTFHQNVWTFGVTFTY